MLFLGETIGFWVQTGVFLLTAGIGLWQIRHLSEQLKQSRRQAENNENLARMRATVDVVLDENANVEFQMRLKKFGTMRNANESFAKYACGDLKQHSEQNDIILPVLNNYEFMAAGIRSGAFDEGIYKRMKKSTVIRDWQMLSGYVMQIRSNANNHALFVEFESIAKKWKDDPPNKAD